MNGLEACRSILSHDPAAKIVMMSGFFRRQNDGRGYQVWRNPQDIEALRPQVDTRSHASVIHSAAGCAGGPSGSLLPPVGAVVRRRNRNCYCAKVY